ncbi:MAG TPA: hypothetical protein VEV17_16600 [Bryobacteraceae bacterium]|nr:hypothetical protein [Bryobacteraceae bacterium]
MKFATWTCLLLFSAAAARAQSAAASGVSAEWDVRKLLDALDLQAQHLKPVIDQVKPETWLSRGAPDTYVAQWKSAQAELRYLLSSSAALSRDPEKLTLALDVYLRMEAMDSTLGSLIEGIRKYQNPALADLTQSVLAENSNNRDRLRQYLQDLAAQKEKEFQIADREAQRCRSVLLNQPAPKERKAARP